MTGECRALIGPEYRPICVSRMHEGRPIRIGRLINLLCKIMNEIPELGQPRCRAILERLCEINVAGVSWILRDRNRTSLLLANAPK